MTGGPAHRGARGPRPGPDRTVGPEPLPTRAGFPLVVVSLPGRDAESLRQQMGEAAEAGADLVEVRLDRLPRAEVERLERVHEIPIMHPWVPAIATLRSRAEGGEGPDDPPSRLALLRAAFDHLPFSVLDVEVARDLPIIEEFRRVDGRPVAMVASAHLSATATPEEVRRHLELALRLGEVGKVVLPATVPRAVEELLPLAQQFRGRPYVLHTTGPSGPLFRALAPRLAMAWVFARLPETAHGRAAVAPVEASQVPVDRLRRFVDSGPETPWFAVVGAPLAHTLSPAIHASFLERTRTGGIYIPLELPKEEGAMAVLPRLIPLGLRGANVTRPFKREAYALSERRSESAATSGAVNTLVTLAGPPDGHFMGHNTDVEALARWWGELEREGRWGGDRLLVVGTGGAARAAVAASVEHGAQVSVIGRRPGAARALASDFPPESVRALEPGALRPFPLVVHATPAGQSPAEKLEVPLAGALGPKSLLVDLVYRPATQELRELARSAGAAYEDGMRMLLYQAARSFELFTGVLPPEQLFAPFLVSATEVAT